MPSCLRAALLLSLTACATTTSLPGESTRTPRRAPIAEAVPAPRGAPEATPPSLRLVVGGDVMFGRYLGRKLRPSGGDDPFLHVRAALRGADLSIVNLETPLSDVDPPALRRQPLPARNLRFRAPTGYAAVLADAGVDVAVLANNHIEDCGLAGIAHTIAALDTAGVQHAGARATEGEDPFAPLWLRAGGAQVALIAASTRRNRGPSRPDGWTPVAFRLTPGLLELLPARVRAAREAGADVVLVSLHWGHEFARRPSPVQQELAWALIDAGASVVLGHHAHVMQPVEAYGGGLILYNMGNLVMDLRKPVGREVGLFELRLAPSGGGGPWRPTHLAVHPLEIPPGIQRGPAPAVGRRAREILRPVVRNSARERFDTRLETNAGGALVWQADPRLDHVEIRP